ncbi:disulfide bond formation protein B [Hydrogenophaga sp. 5NK40-0174]|uniref:disulfide bond formation protein B n=1 Tax=Hydrogenophaga sp. 5NK40-0174 TaxID=3127649 RepID=UPI0031024CA3
MSFPLNMMRDYPRLVLLALAVASFSMLGFGLYLQHVEGLEPCPMCVVQRYAFILVAVVALLLSLLSSQSVRVGGLLLMVLLAGFGAFVAARQTWLQWYPPEILSCGRDFYGMIESFPLKRAIPMIFRGSGDCSVVDWTFLGLSIANWSFIYFASVIVLALVMLTQRRGWH